MSSAPSSFSSVLRYCGSCVLMLVHWAVWLVLGATLAGLIYVLAARELPVPGFVLRRIETQLAQANLTIQFGHASFDPTGRILLEDVALSTPSFETPLVTSRLVYLQRDLWSVLAGQPIPDEIRLEGAVLQLPAMLSPSGTVEPLVRDVALTLRHEDDFWRVDQLTARIGALTLTAQGGLAVPARPAGAPPLSLGEITTRFLQTSRQLALVVHQLDAFDEPALAVQFDSLPGVDNAARFLFTARAAHQPWAQPLTLGSLAATGTLRLDGRPHTVRLHTAIHHAAYLGDYTVENVRAILTARVSPADFSVQPLEALVAAGTLTAEGEQALGPVVHADLAGWPEVHTTVAAQIQGEFVAAEVEAQLKEQTAHLRAEGRVTAALISSMLTAHTPRAAPYFVFGDPVVFRAEAVLGPGWKFASLTSRVQAGRIDSHGVKITAARGRIDIQGLSFLAYDARVELGDSFARGSYWMDFATTDYRMLLDGRLQPLAINGWFIGNWWQDFWRSNFAFPAALPAANVDVQGRWKQAVRTSYFGQANAPAAVVLGADLEQVHSLIFLRPNFTHGLELSATRAGGAQRLDASFKRFTDPVAHETNRLEFNVDSNLGLEAYAHMFAGKADELLASLQFSEPPQLHAQGAIDGRWPGAKPDLTFTGQAGGGLRYHGFPLDTIRVTGGVTGSDVRLDDIQFTAVGGKGTGKAALSGPPDGRQLGFDLYLNGADMARTIRAVEQYHAGQPDQKSGSMADSKFMKRASGGRLDVAVSAQGRLGDLPSFTGTGNAALTGTELAEIHLFGLLSQALSGLSLNFSSLKLDAARTSFRLDGGRLYFPDLKVTGPSAVIDARGDYVFATNALDFTAKFKPFEESRTLLTAAIGIVVNPITSILELKLNGPLSKPNWSVVVGPSAPRPNSPPPAQPPAAAAGDATKPETASAPRS